MIGFKHWKDCFESSQCFHFSASKGKQTKQEKTKASSSEKEKEEGGGKSETPFVIPGYAYNTTTHNINGLVECLERHKVSDPKEVQRLTRLFRNKYPQNRMFCGYLFGEEFQI